MTVLTGKAESGLRVTDSGAGRIIFIRVVVRGEKLRGIIEITTVGADFISALVWADMDRADIESAPTIVPWFFSV